MNLCWTNHEETKVRKLYPSASRDEIVAAIPRHAWQSIRVRARSLGVYRVYPETRPIHPLIAQLVAKRKALALTQEEVAFNAKIDRATIARLERGHKLPFMPTMERWCAALGVEIAIVDRANPQ